MRTEEHTSLPALREPSAAHELLIRLGVTPNYRGFRQCAYAADLAAQNPDRLLLVSKWLYPEVAKRYHTTWCAVERNIRTVSELAWASNPCLLCELADCELAARPKTARFISILAYRLRRIDRSG